MSEPKLSNEQRLELLDKANRVVDLAVEELMRTRGGQVSGSGDDFQFLINLSQPTTRRLKTEINKYLRKCVGGTYCFKETSREQRDGDIRPIDLIMSRHFTSETHEMFIVVDLKGEIYKKGDEQLRGSYARFEAWCRLYYLPTKQRWYVHYVDMIIRHKSPAQRALFVIEHSRSSEEPSRAEERAPDELCLFFEKPQGGTWG